MLRQEQSYPKPLYFKARYWIAILSLLAALLLPGNSGASGPQVTGLGDLPWQWQHPLPQGNTLTGLTCTSPARPTLTQPCLAVGENGTLLSYDGQNWTDTPSPTRQNLHGLACLPATTHCFAVGNAATLLEYNAGSWSVVPTANLFNGYLITTLDGITCYSATLCLAVGEYKTVLYYDGSQWNIADAQPLGPPGIQPRHTVGRPDIFAVSCVSQVRCFTVGFDKIFQFDYDQNAARHWVSSQLADLDEDSLFDVKCPDAQNCWAVGYGRMVWHYDGNQWLQTEDITTTDQLLTLSCPAATDCYAAGTAGLVYHYDGNGWAALDPAVIPTTATLKGLWCNATNCFAAGDYGTLLGGHDQSWTRADQRLTFQNLNGISCPNPVRCVAVGEAGSLLTYDGYTWSPITTTNVTTTLRGVSCFNLNVCWSVGQDGLLVGYVASNWTVATSLITTTLNAVSCPSAQVCLAVGQGGTLARFQDNGWSLMASPDPDNRQLYGLSCPAINRCVAVGQYQTILTYDGTNWQKASNSGLDNFAAVSCPSASRCYAVGGPGLWATYDGTSWQTSNLPDSSFFPLGLACPAVEECTVVGQGRPDTVLNYQNGSWATQSDSVSSLQAVQCAGEYNCWAVGPTGTILARQSLLVVTVADDTADPNRPGTLAAALQAAATRPGQVINFLLPPASQNHLTASNTTYNIPFGTILNGSCQAGSRLNLGPQAKLNLAGGNLLYGLNIQGNLTAHSTGNQILCSAVGQF